ncbi:MAG TPA: DUF4105 domain-containing protein [Aquabacterium sp.]|uniref:lipoprotein N-acyltransferase Lnb domain-containing protein n=1 Tax=Aquabacterium sp. TaxID=1872578 RepID=UPI002E331263|nr:DUF4105 domain-containing protein [Aquabacterium sp.]HEX5356023.1 DUF4105 domain-containing protein [Aquabacterium sp.]
MLLFAGMSPAHAEGHPGVAELQHQVLRQQLDQSPRWAAMLHISDGQARIRDPNFILSLNHFSVRQELLDTVAYLYGPQSAKAVCQFPARYTWLHTTAGLPALSLAHCTDLSEMLARAPADSIALIFASENLSQPSSMMGHLFLKTTGINQAGNKVEHALSFFTDAGTANIPKLFYDSMVTGKKGYFTLTPYQDEINTYVISEQRTLWEYELKLNQQDRTLLLHHLHELRQADITYFFQSYNCATLVKHVLAIGEPAILNDADWWTTPKFVVSRAHDTGMIANATVKTPSRWIVRNLEDELPTSQARLVQLAIESGEPSSLAQSMSADPNEGFMTLELGRAYNTYLYDQQRITSAAWQGIDRQLKHLIQQQYPGLELQAVQNKNPTQSPRDKQVSVGWRHQSGTDKLKLGLLPVSHTMADDNSQSNSETELKLFDTVLLLDPQRGKVSLDHLTIYSTQSLLPRDPMTGGISGGVNIGFERQMSPTMKDGMAFLLEGNLGASWRPARDVDAFVLMGGGWGYHQRGYLYAKPTAGILIREVYNMKSIISISQTTRPLGQSGAATEMRFTQSKYLDRQNTVTLEALRTRRSGQTVNRVDLSFKRLF